MYVVQRAAPLRRWSALAAYIVLFAVLVAWWRGIEPSNERAWQADVAVPARATIEGNLVTVHNIRNFTYRSETDYTPAYYDKRFDLAAELEKLVGPIALYPDDLVAIVLPASTYPLQIVQASRFLDKRKANPKRQPEAAWDDSVKSLVNYPDVVKKLSDDLDWTQSLGEAVVANSSAPTRRKGAARDGTHSGRTAHQSPFDACAIRTRAFDASDAVPSSPHPAFSGPL